MSLGPGLIRVLVVEDQAMVLGAIAALLDLEPDLEVIGQAKSGEQALELIAERSPDVVLTDIEMGGMTGLDLARKIADQHAGIKVAILTTFARPGYLRRALDAQVSAYLLKDAPSAHLAEAIRKIHRGGRAIDPELAIEAWTEADPLTDRERQVLKLAGEGMTTADIASQCHLSEGTVRNYLSEAIGKLGSRNRIEAARLARQKGWL